MKIGKYAVGRSAAGLANAPRAASGALLAFSLIEFVGVMAVVAIVTAMAAPLVVRQADKSVLATEVTELSSISNSLWLQIVRNKAVPDETTWDTVAASWMARPTTQIRTNPRGFQRAFVSDSG